MTQHGHYSKRICTALGHTVTVEYFVSVMKENRSCEISEYGEKKEIAGF